MKRTLFLIAILNVNIAYSQLPCENYCLNFDDSICLNQLNIDIVLYPGNIWQIGQPQKPLFDDILFSYQPNVIVTDTVHPYPVNNNSVFTFWRHVTMGDYYGLSILSTYYNVQTDSLNDYGTIEFSVDKGVSWIDLIRDTVYNTSFVWWSSKPVLTGNSNGWKHFEVMMADLGSIFNIQVGDTLLYRFAFKSDSISDNLGGLMYDDICFWEFVEGVTETRFKSLKSTIYPNPSKNLFIIKFENPAFEVFHLAVYNDQSKLVFSNDNVTEDEVVINSKLLKPGIYFYKLTNPKSLQRSWGKFIAVD